MFDKMMELFMQALQQNQEIDVFLMLGAIKCGLYSRDETTAKLCCELLKRIADRMRA